MTRLIQLLCPRCGLCESRDANERANCIACDQHETAKCIIIGHPHGCAKTITIGDFCGKDVNSEAKIAVLSRAPTCTGSSGGLVLPLLCTEEKAGDGQTDRRSYTHSGARDATQGVTTDTAYVAM